MAEPAPQPWTVEASFAWQERRPDRHELVGGLPPKTMAGARTVLDDTVVNCLVSLGNQLRRGSCRPFTADGSVGTPPGQIHHPDLGVLPSLAEASNGVVFPPRLRALRRFDGIT